MESYVRELDIRSFPVSWLIFQVLQLLSLPAMWLKRNR